MIQGKRSQCVFGLIDTDTFAVDPVNIHPTSTLSNSIKKRKNRGIQANRGSKKEEKMKGREMREKPPWIPHEKCFSELSKIINDSGRYIQPFIKRCNYECFKKIRTTSVLEWLKTRSLIVFIQRTQWRNKTIPNNYDYNSTIKLLCSGKSLLKLNQVIKQTDSQE